MRKIATKLNIPNDNFKLKIGTLNKKNPVSFYIEGNTYITPLKDERGYTKQLDIIRRNFKRGISSLIKDSSLVENFYILNFEVASERIKCNKKTYLNFECYFRQKAKEPKSVENIKNEDSDLIQNITKELFKELSENNFILAKNKK